MLNRPMPGFDSAHRYAKKEVLPGFEPGSPDSESEVLTSYTIRPDLQKCHLLGSNQGPSDLQSDALPTELSRQGISNGSRTRNLPLRRGTLYPAELSGLL